MSFSNSTHAKYWSFTEEEVKSRRMEAFNKSLATRGIPAPITVEEQATLLRLYEYMIRKICQKEKFHFPPKIEATALVFFKRFYLSHSVLDYHVKTVAPTCVYISCKIEENYIDLEDYCREIGSRSQQILELEIKVMEALKFQFIVFHPHRPLHGFIMDMQDNYQNMNEIQEWAKTVLDLAMITDLVLCYPPSQIALACLKMAFSHFSRSSDFESYLSGRFSHLEFFNQMEAGINQICHAINKSPDAAQIAKLADDAKLIDQKVQKAKPKSDPKKRELNTAKEEATKKKKIEEKDQKAKEQMELLTGIPQDGNNNNNINNITNNNNNNDKNVNNA